MALPPFLNSVIEWLRYGYPKAYPTSAIRN